MTDAWHIPVRRASRALPAPYMENEDMGTQIPVSVLSDPEARNAFEASDWGPRGNEFARFRLAGDCQVVIYSGMPGDRQIAVEIVTGQDLREQGMDDTRRSTVLRLGKARARAVASSLMGAAQEL